MPMVNIVGIETYGNNKVVITDDGKRRIAFSDGRGSWVLHKPFVIGEATTPTPDPPEGGGNDGGSTGNVPGSLSARARNGATFTFNSVNLTHAKKLIDACKKIPGANTRKVWVIVMITAIVESAGLWMYSNTGVYPETANYPHDRNGTDHDSVGMFQQRPSMGWGTPKQCMEHQYSTEAFLGLHRNRGLFDIPNWSGYSPGTAAQLVQVSAFPDRYDNVVPVADAIIDALVK